MSIKAQNVNKSFGDFVALDDVIGRDPDRVARPRCSGPAAAASRRCCGSSPASSSRLRHGGDRGQGGHPAAGPAAQCRVRVPALRGLQAPDRLSQRGVRPGDPQAAQGRDQASGSTSCSSSSTSSTSPTAIRRSSPAASASAWRWPARSRSSREVLLLDEPFGALDAQVRKELRAWLRHLHERST